MSSSSSAAKHTGKLAANFAAVLSDKIPAQVLSACYAAQQHYPQGTCALHDVCDANELMLQALGATFPEKCDPAGAFIYKAEDDWVGHLIDAAWPLGRQLAFAAAEVTRLQTAIEAFEANPNTQQSHFELGGALNSAASAEQLREHPPMRLR